VYTPDYYKSKQESWEIVKELSILSPDELTRRIRVASADEIESIKGALFKADPGGLAGSDGGTHIARANAERAGMTLPEFTAALRRIDDCIWDLQKDQPDP
jgi:hypothetical protein